MYGVVRFLAGGWALMGGLLLLVIMFLTTLNAIGFAADRVAGLFGGHVKGVPGYEDIVSLVIAGAATMSLPYCQTQRGHIVVDIFSKALPVTWQQGLDRIWLVGLSLMLSFLAYWMVFGLLEARDDGILSPIKGWSIWPTYIPGIISLLLWALVSLLQALGPDQHVLTE